MQMQSGHPNAAFPIFRSVTKDHADLRPNQLEVDTRRFAGIFPQESPEAISDCGDATVEEQLGDSDSFLRFEVVAALEQKPSSNQIASAPGVDQNSTLTAAQQLVARYRVVHGDDSGPERTTTEVNEKELPQITDDQRSMYTLATPVDLQVTMDMMWKPKPKVHMRHADQLALMEAQNQAIAMMQNAGLKPTDKIQCRRRGCANILLDVQALKYHLHLHNIGDAPTTHTDPSCQPSLPECGSTSNCKTVKRAHSRSRSSFEARPKVSKAVTPLRKRSAGSLLPLRPSARSSTREAHHTPSLSSLAKDFVPDHNPGKPSGPPPARNNKKQAKYSRTPCRGRRITKEATASVGADHPSIAMVLSPSPVMHERLLPTPPTNIFMSITPNPRTEGEVENGVPFPTENGFSIPEKITRSRSPLRALSPTRAMSPIRDGIRRVFSFGCPTESTDE